MRRVQERIRIHGPEQSVDGERSSRLSKDLAAASAEDDPVWNTLCGAGGQGVSHPGGSTGRVVKPYGVIWKVSDFLSEKHPCLYWHMVKPVPKNPYVGRRIEKNPAQNRRGVTCATPLRLKLDISYHGAFLCANRQNTFLVQLGMESCFEPHKRERLPPEEKSIIKFKKRPVFLILDITKDTGCFG